MFTITPITCRVCLEEQNVLINIYDDLEELNTNLCNLLETCVNLQINKDDIFPKYLCEYCTRELLITSKFREKCDKSKEILHEILGNTKLMESKEMFNICDDIEYSSKEDTYNLDIDNLIIEDPVMDDEDEFMNKVNYIEEASFCSPLKNSTNHLMSDTDMPILTNEKIVEAESLSENCKRFVTNPDSATKAEVNSWENTASILTKRPTNSKSTITRVFKCDVCGATFKQALNLQKHLQKIHNYIQFFNCSKCDHCFTLETEFSNHTETCTYKEFYAERKDDNKVRKSDNVIGKLLESENRRKCMYCVRDFPTPFALRMHLRTHTGERPFQCSYCTKSFKTQSQLNVHHKRHTGQADFICTICSKTFYEQSNLTVHMRSHTGERPHVCAVCNKKFTRVSLLQFHMRIHTGEKPFKCIYCNKTFRQHTDLRTHFAVHTGQRQHTCIHCGKSYTKRSHLIHHMRKHPEYTVSEESDNIPGCSSTELNATVNNIKNSEIINSFNEIMET